MYIEELVTHHTELLVVVDERQYRFLCLCWMVVCLVDGNCEDIAMSFLVANVTGSPPIWVKGKIFEIGSTGISSLGGHTEKRSQCVNRFAMEYGRMPLVSTSMKAVDSRSSWFW
uniref:Glycosyl transferase 64 domain-containing protein n=1 Tax=Vitis vinifera TaxID=29760 RepID=A5BDG3_VITVI|nr:hypothetical protein VITISV_038958 [Vitis vinifera]